MRKLLLLLGLISLAPILLGASSAINLTQVGNLGGYQGTDPTAYTPTLTGVGTATGVAFTYSRIGKYVRIDGVFTSGTVAASAFSISLPNGLVADVSSPYATGGYCSASVTSTSGASIAPITVLPGSSTTVVYGTNAAAGSSSNNLSANNGNSLFNNSTQYSCGGILVPISGWSSTSPAGSTQSVLSNGSNERVDRVAWYGNSGVTSACGSSPCTIGSQSGSWVTSVSRASTGTYTINIASGEFSAPPTCVMVPDNLIAGRTCQQSYSTSTSTAVPFQCYNASSTLTDVGASVICMGPH